MITIVLCVAERVGPRSSKKMSVPLKPISHAACLLQKKFQSPAHFQCFYFAPPHSSRYKKKPNSLYRLFECDLSRAHG